MNKTDAPVQGVPIAYIERMKEYHPDHPPYRWAHATEPVEMAPAPKLPRASVAIIALTGAHRVDDQPFDTSGDSRIRFIDPGTKPEQVTHTHFAFKRERVATDPGALLPLWALEDLVLDGHVGSLAGPVISAFGSQYSQRRVRDELIPTILQALEPLHADIALIVPACPLDHQTAAMLSRSIEASGIAAIVATVAKDITLYCGATRAVYVHAPIGWMFGMPGDARGQYERTKAILQEGLSITTPGTVHELSHQYPLGSVGLPTEMQDPDLHDWEVREFTPGYETG